MKADWLGCCVGLLAAVQGCGGGVDGAGRGEGGDVDKGAQAVPVAGAGSPAAKAAGHKVFVARHCDYRHPGGRLSEEGRAQAAAIAAKLKDKRIDVILHSPIVRCEETARLVWEGLDRQPRLESAEWLHEDARLDKDWRERLAAGNVLLVTHSPVIRQLTSTPNAAGHGEVTEVK